MLHDPNIQPRSGLSKEQYMKKDEQTTVNHFHEKLLKLKDMMKTKVHGLKINQRMILHIFPPLPFSFSFFLLVEFLNYF